MWHHITEGNLRFLLLFGTKSFPWKASCPLWFISSISDMWCEDHSSSLILYFGLLLSIQCIVEVSQMIESHQRWLLGHVLSDLIVTTFFYNIVIVGKQGLLLCEVCQRST